MRRLVFAALLAVVCSVPSLAQDSMLDHLSGHWVLRGSISGKSTVHDVDADWVLNRRYLRLHEISRERNAVGAPEYEAFVYLSYEQKPAQYNCLWLDTTSNAGLSNSGIAHGSRRGNEILFVFFPNSTQEFHNTFAYDNAKDSWTWTMVGFERGKIVPFARLTLTRR